MIAVFENIGYDDFCIVYERKENTIYEKISNGGIDIYAEKI